MSTRKRPNKYTLDGFPIYYSLETHTTSSKIKSDPPSTIFKIRLTFREAKSKRSCKSPDYGKILYSQTLDTPYSEEPSTVEIHTFIASHSLRFWENALQHNDSIFDNWLVPHSGLPLVIAWAIDRELLSKSNNWAKSTCIKKEQIMTRLLTSDLRALPIGQFDASVYGPTMIKYSKSTHNASVSLINQIMRHETLTHRLSPDIPPLKLPHRGKSTLSSSASLVREHIRRNTLTREQISKLITQSCIDLSKRTTGIYKLAFLLFIAMAIPMDELCYLRLSHVICDKNHFPFLVQIQGKRIPKNKNFYDLPYAENSPHYRILPIPHKLATVLHPIMKKRCSGLSEEHLKQQYLISHPKNPMRGCSPKDIIHWINHTFKNECLSTPILDETGCPIPSHKSLPPYKKIYKTAQDAFYHNGFEIDEYNYYFGLSQTSVAGKTYCDFANVGEQRRMAQIMDMRLPAPPTTSTAPHSDFHISNPIKYHTFSYLSDNHATSIYLKLSFPPRTDDTPIERPYLLEIATRGGFSGGVSFKPHTK